MKKVKAYKYDIKSAHESYFSITKPKELIEDEGYTICEEGEKNEEVDIVLLEDYKVFKTPDVAYGNLGISYYNQSMTQLPCPHCGYKISKVARTWLEKCVGYAVAYNCMHVILCRKCYRTSQMFPFTTDEKQELILKNEQNVKFLFDKYESYKLVSRLKNSFFVKSMVYRF